MAKFYLPELMTVEKTSVIVYMCEGIEGFVDRTDPNSIKKHLKQLYRKNFLLVNGDFNIDILWADRELMTDVWKYTLQWDSGALSQATTFRGFETTTDFGTSAEYGHYVLGREAEQRLWTFNGETKKYLRKRPSLRAEVSNGEIFNNF